MPNPPFPPSAIRYPATVAKVTNAVDTISIPLNLELGALEYDRVQACATSRGQTVQTFLTETNKAIIRDIAVLEEGNQMNLMLQRWNMATYAKRCAALEALR
jgi:hypothetical protein